MNDINQHIICLFEDVQYHLEELGFPSSIREGKISIELDGETYYVAHTDNYADSPIHYCNEKDPSLRSSYIWAVGGQIGMINVVNSSFQLLYDLLPMYLELNSEGDPEDVEG